MNADEVFTRMAWETTMTTKLVFESNLVHHVMRQEGTVEIEPLIVAAIGIHGRSSNLYVALVPHQRFARGA